MKIFILASSYSAHSFICNLEYLINDDVESVYLLSENHEVDEFVDRYPFEIKCLPDVVSCIQNSDITFLLEQKNIPLESINNVKKLCTSLSKKFIAISDPWEIAENDVYKKRNENSIDIQNKPIIDYVYCGNHSQPYSAELLLNKIFNFENIKFKQFVSSSTFMLLVQIESFITINTAIKSSCIDNCCTNPDIIVRSFDAGDNLQYLNDYINSRKYSEPDFIIFQTMLEYLNYTVNEIKQLFRYKIDREIDHVIISPYHNISLSDGIYVYCKQKYFPERNINHAYEEMVLRNKLIEKIALPSGIIPLS